MVMELPLCCRPPRDSTRNGTNQDLHLVRGECLPAPFILPRFPEGHPDRRDMIGPGQERLQDEIYGILNLSVSGHPGELLRDSTTMK